MFTRTEGWNNMFAVQPGKEDIILQWESYQNDKSRFSKEMMNSPDKYFRVEFLEAMDEIDVETDDFKILFDKVQTGNKRWGYAVETMTFFFHDDTKALSFWLRFGESETL